MNLKKPIKQLITLCAEETLRQQLYKVYNLTPNTFYRKVLFDNLLGVMSLIKREIHLGVYNEIK